MNSVLVIAAESSGAQYAADLMDEFKRRERDIHFFGIGDQAMVDKGFHALARAEELAVVGIQEVLANYRKIKKAFDDVLVLVDENKPDLAILIDYPGFNLKLSKELHEREIPVVYYVSPQIWAWKKGRIKTVKKYVDHMLVLFPFEEKFYLDHDVKVTCVGHPMLDAVDDSLLGEDVRQRNRSRYGLTAQDYLLGIMPGSRRKELQMHLPTQIETARILHHKFPQMRFAILVAPTVAKDEMDEYFDNVRFPYIMIKDDPLKMISLCDGILAASGTATLQVAFMKRPMVIMYRMNYLTSVLARMLVSADFFGLVNIILGREAVPERFQEKANPKHLSDLVSQLVTDEKARADQLAGFTELRTLLKGGATTRVADVVEGYFK